MKPLAQRKSPRLKGYDYTSEGAYFITVCTHERRFIFVNIVSSKMKLNSLGQLVHDTWLSIPAHKSHVYLDHFVVMPNHFHGIIILDGATAAIHHRPTSSHVELPNIISAETIVSEKSLSLGTIVGHFKAAVTLEARKTLHFMNKIWQSSYYDHIIRKEESLNFIRQYVIYNPAKWAEDEFYRETDQ